MTKIKIQCAAVFLICHLFMNAQGQVGLNVLEPMATLDIGATNIPNVPEGFAPPRLTGDDLIKREAYYNEEEAGTMVYVTAVPQTSHPKTINITEPGYYYFNGTIWVTFKGQQGGFTNLSASQVILPPFGFTRENHDSSLNPLEYDTNDWWLMETSSTAGSTIYTPFPTQYLVYEYVGPIRFNPLFFQVHTSIQALNPEGEGTPPRFAANVLEITTNTLAGGRIRFTVYIRVTRVDQQGPWTEQSILNLLVLNTPRPTAN